MKKSLLFLLAIAILFSMAYSPVYAINIPPIDIHQLKTGSKILRVGRIADFPPFYFKNNATTPGLDYEIFAAVMQRSGIKKMVYVDFNNFTELNQALNNGKIDVIVNDYWDVPEHCQFLLTIPYYLRDGIAFVYDSQRNHFDGIDDLKNRKIAAFQGSTDVVEWIKSQPELKRSLTIYASRTQMLTALEKREIDAAFVYFTLYMDLFHNWNQAHKLKVVKVKEINSTFGLRKQDALLCHILNKAIASMWADGSLYEIKKKYLNPIDIEPAKTINT